MASITSLGIGSGVLTNDLVDQLIEAERAPTENRLDTKQADVEAELSAIGQLKSALTDLRLPSRVLGNPDSLNSLTATTSSSAFSVDASSEARTGSYSIEVDSVASAQSLRTGEFATADSTDIGTGTISFSVNGQSTDITVDSTNNSLQGLANAINADDALGINADVIDTGSAFVLVLTSSQTGADNQIEITVTDDDGNNTDSSGLSQFVYTTGTQNLTESVAASDATISINGLSVSRASNTFSDVIDGLTFTVSSETTSAATLTVGQDTAAVFERVSEFVDSYNAFKTVLNDLTVFDPNNTANNGVLVGDQSARTLNNQIRLILSQAVPGLDGANVRSLADVGITTNSESGLLSIDESTFVSQLQSNPEDVTALFADQGRTTDAQVSFLSANSVTQPGTYDIEITQAATRGALVGSVGLGASIVIDSDNDEFVISVDSTTSNTITLTAGTYTQSELVEEIQTQISADSNLSTAGASVIVSLDGSSQIQIESSSYGSASQVELTSVDTDSLAELGLDVVAGTAGLDVAGTINGQTGTGSGQILRAFVAPDSQADDASEGLSVLIEGTAIGSRGSVTYIEGVAEQLVDRLTEFLSLEGIIGIREAGLNNDLDTISDDRLDLEARLEIQRARLVSQFTAADILVGQLQNTQDFLETQFQSISGNNNDSN